MMNPSLYWLTHLVFVPIIVSQRLSNTSCVTPDGGESVTLLQRMQRKDAAPCNDKNTIYVNTEWERLREVIVGGAGFRFPSPNFTWKAGAMAILPGDDYGSSAKCLGHTNWECCTGTPGIDLQCPDEPPPEDPLGSCCTYMGVEKEAQKMIAMLQEEGVKVHRISNPLTVDRLGNNWGDFSLGPEGSGGMDIFPRDIMQVIQNVVIDLDLGAPNRRGEILDVQDLFKNRLPGNALHVSMPQHDFQDVATGTYNKSKYPVIEGGDVMLLGDTILVGVSDNHQQGSSHLGVDWLRDTLHSMGISKKVEAVRLDQRILHLDLVMSAPRHGVAVVATKPSSVNGAGTVIPTPDPNDTWLAFPDGLPAVLDTWKRLEVTGLAGMFMATNAIPVSEDVVIMATNSGAPNSVQQEMVEAQQALKDMGMKVRTIDFVLHGSYGGAMRCSTHPLQRWN